jgi:hypothetical protein
MIRARFQDMMNHILKYLPAKDVNVYIDIFVIYPQNTEQHYTLVEEVLERLAKNHLVIVLEIFT